MALVNELGFDVNSYRNVTAVGHLMRRHIHHPSDPTASDRLQAGMTGQDSDSKRWQQ